MATCASKAAEDCHAPRRCRALRQVFGRGTPLPIFFVFLFVALHGEAASVPHAHNDYLHQRPLLDALDHGFCSVEADIHLVNGQLLVAHDADKVDPRRTLEELYLEPLKARFSKNKPASQFFLMIDFKTEAESTYAVLRQTLKRYASILTAFGPNSIETNAVTVIISGNRPINTISNEPLRFAAIDGRLSDLESDAPRALIPWISDNWTKHFTWRGQGEMPEPERARLHQWVERAHEQGRMIRFWAIPDNRRGWLEVRRAGVDLINTDDLSGLSNFLASAAGPPNIILVMTDDQGYGDLSFTGNPILKTPHLDAFARQSVRFTDFHVSPTCAPTRSALMTGRHEFKNGVTHTIYERERLTLRATTVAEVLKKAGYVTGIFGKWHLGDEPAYQPDRRGFDEVFIHGAGGIGQTYAGSCGDAPGNSYFDPAILHNGRFKKTKGYCTDVFFRQALQWMNGQRTNNSPFLAYITPNAPHAPLECPEEYVQRYRGKVPENVAKFFGMIANIDDNFGAMLKKLDEWAIADNTLVVFMTDNGGTAGVKIFNAGMRGGKVTPYVGGTRVPSFWRWPLGFAGGKDCSALAAHMDIFPTFSEIGGVKLAGTLVRQVEGRSLLPLLKNPAAAWPDRYLVTHVGRWKRGRAAEAKFDKCAIRNTRFALVNNSELYDLATDYSQTTNIITEQPEAVATLRAEYDRWWNEVQPLLINENVTGPQINPFKALYWKQLGGTADEALLKKMDPARDPEAAQGRVH